MKTVSPSTSGNHEKNAAEGVKRFGWADIIVIILIAAGTALTIPTIHNHTSETVSVYRDNRKIATYPLEQDRTFSVQGSIGKLTIAIKNRNVSVESADCPHHICEKTGPVSLPHAQIVCAPNHIVIVINSTTPDSIDAISR
jgi:hypothetical protein